MAANFEVLAHITAEPPALPPIEHAGAHILNTPIFERKYAKAYLGNPDSRDATALRRQIAKGAREALEEQYWEIMDRTIQARPMEARLGGDPSIANKVRAFLLVRYYRNGEWEDRIEVRWYCRFTIPRFLTCLYFLVDSRTTDLGENILFSSNRARSGGFGRGHTVPTSH